MSPDFGPKPDPEAEQNLGEPGSVPVPRPHAAELASFLGDTSSNGLVSTEPEQPEPNADGTEPGVSQEAGTPTPDPIQPPTPTRRHDRNRNFDSAEEALESLMRKEFGGSSGKPYRSGHTGKPRKRRR